MKNKILLLGLLIFILSRVLYLDRDLPPGEKTKFGEKDEQAYNFTALNLYHFGSISKQIDNNYSIKGSINTILNNVLPYATLVVLGNNYFGLRAGAVIASILIFFLFFHLLGLHSCTMPEKEKQYVQLILVLFLATNFGFLVASRNAAPTIFRALFIMLIISYIHYVAAKPAGKQSVHLFLLGMACSFLVFFSYLTNAFIFAGVLLFVVFKGFNERSLKWTLGALGLMLAGAGSAALIANVIYITFFGDGVLNSVSSMFAIYDVRIFGNQSNGFGMGFLLTLYRDGIRKIILMLSSNMFAFNFTLLFLVFISCWKTVRLVLKRKTTNHLQLLSLSFILAYTAQAFFYNPDASKWIVMMLPVFLIAIVSNLVLREPSPGLEGRLKSPRRDMGSLVFFLLACGLAAYRLFRIGMDGEFSILMMLSLIVLPLVMWSMRLSNSRLKQLLLPAVLLLTLMPSAFLSVKYIIINPEFHYRDACIAIDGIIGDKNVAGVWCDGFRLYTKGNAFFPWYQVQDEGKHRRGLTDIFERKLADYTVDFPSGDFFDPQRDINARARTFQLRRIASLYLGKGSLGQSIWVYKRTDKDIPNFRVRQP